MYETGGDHKLRDRGLMEQAGAEFVQRMPTQGAAPLHVRLEAQSFGLMYPSSCAT